VTRPLARNLTLEQERVLRRRLRDLRELETRVKGEIMAIELRLERRGRGRTPRKELEHGTDSGYLWHIRKGIPFPEDEGGEVCGCREAHRVYQAWVRWGRRKGEPRPLRVVKP
jgi:hypothetical protein